MENKILDETRRSNDVANEAIDDSIDRAKLFIDKGMYKMASDELDYLKRLIVIKNKYDKILLDNKQSLIDELLKTEAN